MRDLGRRLGSDEFSEWLAFARVEPTPLELQRATLEAVVALLNCWIKKRVSAEDFLPQRASAAPKRQTPDEQIALLKAAFGGRIRVVYKRDEP